MLSYPGVFFYISTIDFFPNPCWHPYGEFFTAHCRKNAEIGCQYSAFPQRYLTTPWSAKKFSRKKSHRGLERSLICPAGGRYISLLVETRSWIFLKYELYVGKNSPWLARKISQNLQISTWVDTLYQKITNYTNSN